MFQEGWVVVKTTNTLDGKKVYHTCKERRNCPAEMFLLYRTEDLEVAQYTSGEHDHAEDRQNARGIHPKTKADIDSLYKDGVKKPRAILAALRTIWLQ